MNVSAATVGQSGLTAAIAQPPLPPSPAPSPSSGSAPAGDVVESAVGEFSHPAIHAALHLPETHAAADALIHQATQALAAHDIPKALQAVHELLTRQPDADLRVLHEPALAPIRDGVREVVNRLVNEARLDARKTLAIAAPLAALPRMPNETPAVLALANQFIETGQYINYVRAGQLGRVVISWSEAESGPEDHAEQNVTHAIRRVAALWTRAPLLVLLMAWLLFGIVLLPLDAELWAVGFLTLVLLQFVLTLRNWRR